MKLLGRDTAVQFLKFGIVGVSNTAVAMGTYYIVLWIHPSLYLLGHVLGTILSIANAFFWNDRFVFTGNAQDLPSVLRRLGKTYVSYGGTSALSAALLWAEVALFYMDRRIAPVVNLFLTIPLNFIINRSWTFRRDGGKDHRPGETGGVVQDSGKTIAPPAGREHDSRTI